MGTLVNNSSTLGGVPVNLDGFVYVADLGNVCIW